MGSTFNCSRSNYHAPSCARACRQSVSSRTGAAPRSRTRSVARIHRRYRRENGTGQPEETRDPEPLRARVTSPVVRALGSNPAIRAMRSTTRRHLRILAYHAAPNPEKLSHQLDHIAADYTVVDLEDVVAWYSGQALPPNPVWITFDDGDRSVVDVASPLLRARGMTATVFVCPGVLDTQDPFWWQNIPPVEVAQLKRVPDVKRRSVLAGRNKGVAPQLTAADLRDWIRTGNSVGNHTWDHPLLTRCALDEQLAQIRQAHEWLVDVLGPSSARCFAYPNGDWTAESENELRRLGYDVALLFDHRLARRDQNPLRLSRLRIDADAPASRARSILSGGHSAAFHLSRRSSGQ